MKKTIYVRKGKTITHVESKLPESFSSINAAKRASRELQLERDGALGRGSVAVAS